MYQELRSGGRRVMVRTEDWKLVEFMDARIPEREGALYNLRTDPGECWNLWSDPAYREVVEALRTRAAMWDPSTKIG
jgi:arylsulfatase A-like enzyme